MSEKTKKRIEELIEEIEYPSGKKKYKGYKKGFTRKYTKYSK